MNYSNQGQNPEILVYKVSRKENNTAEIQLHSKNKLEVGDHLNATSSFGFSVLTETNQPIPANYFIVDEVLENRDCKGKFNNPETAKKSWYKVLAHPAI